MKVNLEQLEEMQKELFRQQCDLDIQKAMVKHFIKERRRAINFNRCCETLNEDNYEHVLTFKDGKIISDKFIKIE